LRSIKYLRVVIHFDRALIKTYCDQVTLKERHQGELTADRYPVAEEYLRGEEKKGRDQEVREAKRTLFEGHPESAGGLPEGDRGTPKKGQKGFKDLLIGWNGRRVYFAYGKSKPEAAKGKLPPCSGESDQPIREKGQNGVEIKAPMGSEIRPFLAGKVLYAIGLNLLEMLL